MKKILTIVLLTLLRMVSFMPFPLLYMISNFIFLIIKHILHYRYKMVISNLQRSFPEKEEKEILEIADKYYKHLADLIVETIKLLNISDKQLEQHISVRNHTLIEKLASDGRPIIVYLGHYGNWEWVQEVTRHYKRPYINAEIYRVLRNKAMDDVMHKIRSRFDTTQIPQHRAIHQLMRMHRDGKQFLVGFVSDQRPNDKNLYHWMEFLNQDTAFAVGGEELGKRLNAHFVFLKVEKPSRGHYIMTFKEMKPKINEDNPYPYSTLFMKLLEESICEAPEYWLWSHNRWKYDRTGKIIHK